MPYAFTEQGVAMLSSIVNSKTAVLVNMQIMRSITKLREMLSTHKELRDRINQLERKYDQQFRSVFDAIKNIVEPITQPKQIGFRPSSDGKARLMKGRQ